MCVYMNCECFLLLIYGSDLFASNYTSLQAAELVLKSEEVDSSRETPWNILLWNLKQSLTKMEQKNNKSTFKIFQSGNTKLLKEKLIWNTKKTYKVFSYLDNLFELRINGFERLCIFHDLERIGTPI